LAGVVLSNHGGRQLDFSRSGIEVLIEVAEKLKEKRGLTLPDERFQVFVDGGVRRATDVLKAVALGATAGKPSIVVDTYERLLTRKSLIAVGIGRPFIYSFCSYGTEGVDHALQILKVGHFQYR
jgi:L-lactate dehydrogenase (cytochrome)